MPFSFYEIYTTSLRAFAGLGFPHGVDEDAAYTISFLELYDLNGIKRLANTLDKLDKNFDGKLNLNQIKLNKNINIKKKSLLMNGPGLMDYIYQKTNKINHEIIIKNCIDPIFIIPVVFKIVTKENFLINLCWIKNTQQITSIISNKKILIGKQEKKISIKKNQLYIQFVFDKKQLLENNLKIKSNSILYKINIKKEILNINKTLNPKKQDWIKVSKIASRVFVPESKESRLKGAGGGDDND